MKHLLTSETAKTTKHEAHGIRLHTIGIVSETSHGKLNIFYMKHL